MKVNTQYENQYFESDPTDEVWVLRDGKLEQITGGDEEDDDSEKRQ